MCQSCGALVSDKTEIIQDSHGFGMNHNRAKEIREDIDRKLLASRKLKLILDLDETLIHAQMAPPQIAPPPQVAASASQQATKETSSKDDKTDKADDAQPPVKDGNEKKDDSCSVGASSTGPLVQLPDSCYIQIADNTRHRLFVRPHLAEFLACVSEMYELKLYTNGLRYYVDAVLAVIDPNGTYFKKGRNVISRDDSPEEYQKALFTPASSETVQIGKKVIMPSLGSPATVVIIDDRKDIWYEHLRNLLQIYPCLFHVSNVRFSSFNPFLFVLTDYPERPNMSGLEEHHLLWMKEKLKKIHHEFFARVDAGETDVDVRVCSILLIYMF